LNRKGISGTEGEWSAFGSTPYAREELVAEMGAAFLSGHAGIVERTLDNSAAYIQSWLARLKEDRRLIVQAAAAAQKAADFILGKTWEEKEEAE
jgi:antirestriction protein ArdC